MSNHRIRLIPDLFDCGLLAATIGLLPGLAISALSHLLLIGGVAWAIRGHGIRRVRAP